MTFEVDSTDEFFDVVSDKLKPQLLVEEAFNNIGVTMYPDTLLLQALAYLKVHGGEDEAVTQNPNFFFVARLAQWRFDIRGAHIPYDDAVEEIETYAEQYDWNPKPDWTYALKERYGLRFPQ